MILRCSQQSQGSKRRYSFHLDQAGASSLPSIFDVDVYVHVLLSRTNILYTYTYTDTDMYQPIGVLGRNFSLLGVRVRTHF